MAGEITWQDVIDTALDNADDFSGFSPRQQKLILDATTRWVPYSRYQADTFDARRYYAAHLASMHFGPAAGEGTKSNESIGDVSEGVTLAVNNPPANQRILSTTYGELYWQYQQANFSGIFVG